MNSTTSNIALIIRHNISNICCNTIILLCLFSTYNAIGQDYAPILAKQIPVYDTFFNHTLVEDDYRWLEDIHGETITNWVDGQSKLSKKYLDKAVSKTNSFRAIDKYSYTDYDHPVKKGKYYFTYAYYNNLGAPALFYQSTLRAQPMVLIDPNYISRKDKISLKGYDISKDSKYLAYQFNRNGSDWTELMVNNIGYGNKKDHLTGLKFSTVAWLGDGFFYSTLEQQGEFGSSLGQKVYYHKIDTEQKDDKLIFQRRKNPFARFYYSTTSDERYFVLKERNERDGKINIFYIDYKSENPVLRPLLINLKEDVSILDSYNGKFVALSSHKSSNGSIVLIDPANPLKWEVIAAEYAEAQLLEVMPFRDRIVAIYQADQHPILTVLDYTGAKLYSLEMPVATSLDGFSGDSSNEELLFSFSSYTIPKVVYKFNIRTFQKELTKMTSVTFDFNKIEYEEVEYLSEDSTPVSMVLVHEKGLELDGNNPTILEAYGGFGAIVAPSFDPGIVHFIKKGGIYAFANIRGGGDKGLDWADAGRGDNKQNSFDDFVAAAEYLIAHNYTSANKLAITGASNGGLVVAASAIQRPDLFAAVVPVVAPLDMLRFEKFTVGHLHTDEYGTVNDSLSFINLFSYSPYHNIKENVNYPTMLVITSENDDRVPPFHSYKFVARLQNREAQTNPIILKVETKSGHHGANSFMSTIHEYADIYGFILNELND